jgi:hypothetical protein
VISFDASPVGFGAVAWLRMPYGNKIHVSLVMAKGRLAPFKQTTIPRLEFGSGGIGCQPVPDRETGASTSSVEFHTDSKIV